MKIIEIFRISFTNLRANRMRSLLTVLGISVGIAAIVFLVSLGYGLQQLSVKKIASIEAINTLDVSMGKEGKQKVDKEFIEKVSKMSEIEKVSPLLVIGIKASFKEKTTDSVGNFVDDDFASLEGVAPVVGGFFSNSEKDIVASTAFLKALDIVTSDAVGKEISANIMLSNAETKEQKAIPKKFNILGVIQDDSTAFCYIPIASVASELGEEINYNSIKVKTKDKSQVPSMKEKLTSMGYSVTSIADTISQVDQIFRIIQIILAFFGLVALLVASIGMFNTMTIALLERTRDIGIMKAVGVRNKDVSRIFLSEAAIIAGLGGIIGVLGGWVTSKLVNFGINMLAKSVGGEPETLFVMPVYFALAIIVFSFFVGLATGFYPSKRASGLNPLDALRYE